MGLEDSGDPVGVVLGDPVEVHADCAAQDVAHRDGLALTPRPLDHVSLPWVGDAPRFLLLARFPLGCAVEPPDGAGPIAGNRLSPKLFAILLQSRQIDDADFHGPKASPASLIAEVGIGVGLVQAQSPLGQAGRLVGIGFIQGELSQDGEDLRAARLQALGPANRMVGLRQRPAMFERSRLGKQRGELAGRRRAYRTRRGCRRIRACGRRGGTLHRRYSRCGRQRRVRRHGG